MTSKLVSDSYVSTDRCHKVHSRASEDFTPPLKTYTSSRGYPSSPTHLQKLHEHSGRNDLPILETEVEYWHRYGNDVLCVWTGTIVVSLPFRFNISQLGESKSLVVNRFFPIVSERRFARVESFKQTYVRVIKEGPHYIDSLGNRKKDYEKIFKCPPPLSSLRREHALCTWSVTQRDLYGVLLSSRFWRYIILADIEQMYSY